MAEPLIVVAAALVIPDGRVLLQRRPSGKHHGGLWEFPGGKVERGETPETALVRELVEELGVTVRPGDLSPVTFASVADDARHLLLLLFRTGCWSGELRPLDATALAWVPPGDMAAWSMPPADDPLAAALATVG